MIKIEQFKNLRLQGGFVIKDIELAEDPIADAIGREAVGQTRIVAHEFRLPFVPA